LHKKLLAGDVANLVDEREDQLLVRPSVHPIHAPRISPDGSSGITTAGHIRPSADERQLRLSPE
jgi:hypothetical protein